MEIKQFEDNALAHFSYAVFSEETREIILIDPARDPKTYYEFADENDAEIIGIIETHPHADFVSSHLEIHETTGANIYVSKIVEADYPHETFDEGSSINIGSVKLKAVNTPGHSPDSISVVVVEDGKDKAVFTGDTLFIGDVGRPDLREKTGKVKAKREELARQMYKSTREKLMKLDDHVIVYPAHGSGSLCGKAISDAKTTTVGAEKRFNYALQDMTEDQFMKMLLQEQPFIPKYFSYDVALNKKGAPAFLPSIEAVRRREVPIGQSVLIIDGRQQKLFKKNHLKGAINIPPGNKFETWLGSIIGPEEGFYLVAETEKNLKDLIKRAAKIGYELIIEGAMVHSDEGGVSSDHFDLSEFKKHMEAFTIMDLRNPDETKKGKIFESALTIPLPHLRERIQEIPVEKPIVVHCAGGYRSAIGSSILEANLPVKVFDMSEDIKKWTNT